MEENEQPKRIGKGMIIVAWLLVLGILTLFASNILERQHNPNKVVNNRTNEEGVREVILQRNRSGHYVAVGELNNMPVNFLLDTGATWISIPERIAHKLNLPKGPEVEVSTANGIVTTYATKVDTVSLGNIQLHDVKASINPYASDDDILLGMSFLKELELIQRDDTLILRQHPSY